MNYLLFFVLFLPIYIITIFIPFWTRKTESFGVTIPEEVYYSDKLKNMRKQYATSTVLLSIITTIIFLILLMTFGNNETTLGIIICTIIILYLIISFVIYLKFHSTMKSLKEKENWKKDKTQQIMINIGFHKQKLTYSNMWFLIPILAAFFLIYLTFQFYMNIPNQIPMQYNFQGEVTNLVEKSYRSVLLHPVMMIYLSLLLLFVNVTIAKSKQQVDLNNPEESLRKNVVFRRRWSLFLVLSSYALSAIFVVAQLSLIYAIDQKEILFLPLIITLAIIVGAIILSFTTGQGGSRIKGYQTSNGTVLNRDDDKYWKWGQFYFNKEDPALFLEKRFGIGWTINFARPLAWIIFLLIIGIAFGLPALLGS
jgi:uncharacterized membrane protein